MNGDIDALKAFLMKNGKITISMWLMAENKESTSRTPCLQVRTEMAMVRLIQGLGEISRATGLDVLVDKPSSKVAVGIQPRSCFRPIP